MAQFPKAYREVLEILKYIPEEDYNKIPRYIVENMEKEQDKEYNYNVTEFRNFEKQEMLQETEAILSVLFREYWATEEQRNWIYEKESLEKRKIEEEKTKNYTPLNDIFQKNDVKGEQLEETIIKNYTKETRLQKNKEVNLLQKIVMQIRRIFTKIGL